MTPDRAKAWTAVFGLLSQVWPFLTPTTERAKVWDLALSDLSPDEFAQGVQDLLANLAHQPTPADLRDAVQGKLQWVDVWKRDAFGSVPLVNGAPIVVGRQRVRVKRGAPSPVLLSWGKPDDLYAGGAEPKKLPEMRMPKELTEALCKRMRPQ